MGEAFCYLLGAGASAHALPVVNRIPERLEEFAKRLREHGRMGLVSGDRLAEDIEWLLEEVKNHATIDTLAKKLFLRRSDRELTKLKAVTSCFFVGEQAGMPVDYRYNSFLASVLVRGREGALEFPANLRFLTWNYDTQIEKAFFGFCDNEDETYNQVTRSERLKRLNGCCATHPPGHFGAAYRASIRGDWHEGAKRAVELHDQYTANDNEVPPDIKFAWESDPGKLANELREFLGDVTTTVIIGYSFPFFNREVDRVILNAMASVRRLYVQMPKDRHQETRERMATLRSDLRPSFLEGIDELHIPSDFG